MSYTNVIHLTTLIPTPDLDLLEEAIPNQVKLYRYFKDAGVEQCNIFGVGDVWRNGKLAPMTEEFAAEMLDMIAAPVGPPTVFDDIDGPCDCCTKNSNCCLRDGHNGDCDSSMSDTFIHMMKHLL